ncbi:MAG: hypothetical protein FJZ47_15355 [Candidatus Tectomicrobia bacterium]|uniref:Outer membrane lipoprotein BamD-like domain-containing protein n=1 Tax=Tectimicrobiota bacterium TaxID=2528274 RepID=A0A937W4V9_UNCTE|nr:hypothetical protein [Candidatus Tectomicrobia bacterium]
MKPWFSRRALRYFLLGMCCLSSCTPAPTPPTPYALFPPQEVLEEGNYARFYTANTQALAQCEETATCEMTLLNLAFAHIYPSSPYYDQGQALRYLNDLTTRYPRTPAAAQAQVWRTLLQEQLTLSPHPLIEKGDFARFRTVNTQLVERCDHTPRCDVALFNLGFVHAHPRSPFYNRAEALRHFDMLIKRYPQTPWAVQGQAWITLLQAQGSLEEARRRLQADLRTKDATIRSKETALRTRESAMRAKDAQIRSLQEQMERVRAIDAEMDQKERELLR